MDIDIEFLEVDEGDGECVQHLTFVAYTSTCGCERAHLA